MCDVHMWQSHKPSQNWISPVCKFSDSKKKYTRDCTFVQRKLLKKTKLIQKEKNPSWFLFHSCFSSVTSVLLLSTRKSYEFEDLLQSSSEGCRVDWYAQSRLGLARTLSEENVYEDIIGKTTASSL